MLAPPENGASRDEGALDEAGRQRYLNSLGIATSYTVPIRDTYGIT